MKVIIDIPKEFGEDIRDNFQDFFERVKVEIAHRVNTDDTLLCGNYELETADMFLDAFKSMQIIPNKVTNGEMMLSMYPSAKIIRQNEMMIVIDIGDGGAPHSFWRDWWDSPYKEGE